MASQTRLPTADDAIEFTPVGTANNWENVDEISPNDTDYNYKYQEVGVPSRDRFTFSVFALPVGSEDITVKIHVRGKDLEETFGAYLYGVLLIDSTEYYSDMQMFYDTWADFVCEWATNPSTGLPWTQGQVNGVGDHHIEAFGYCLAGEMT